MYDVGQKIGVSIIGLCLFYSTIKYQGMKLTKEKLGNVGHSIMVVSKL